MLSGLGNARGLTLAKSGWARATQCTHRQAVVRCAPAENGQPTVASNIETTGQNMTAVMDYDRIAEILPHRYPFLLVDRVVECEPGSYGVGYKYLSANEDFFNGHFPGRPIMPGVLQVEAMAQLGGLVLLPTLDASARDKFFFGGIDKCKFKRPVVPGDCLMMKVEVVKFNPRYGICKLAGKAYVGEQVTCEAELTVVVVK